MQGQGPHNRNPLLLSPGQLPRIGLRISAQPHPLEQGKGFCLHGRGRPALNLYRGQGDVFEHRQIREQVVALKDHPDFLPQFLPVGFVGDHGLTVKRQGPGLKGFQAV